MRILGIDPGLKNTGYGLIVKKGSQPKCYTSGVIRTSPDNEFPQRLSKIYNGVSEVIEEWTPKMISVEEAIYAQNVRIAIKLGHARSAAILAASNKEIDIFEYSPKKIKSSVTGNGRAKKEQLRYMVKTILNLPSKPPSLDESDAMGAAICHLNQFKFSKRK